MSKRRIPTDKGPDSNIKGCLSKRKEDRSMGNEAVLRHEEVSSIYEGSQANNKGDVSNLFKIAPLSFQIVPLFFNVYPLLFKSYPLLFN